MSGKQKVIKSFFSITILSALLLQAGCAFKDIDKRSFVLSVGIDPSEKVRDGFRVTLKLAKPAGDVKAESSQSFSYLTYDAESVGEAIRIMETHVDKKLDMGHNRSIIINKELLSKDFDTFMDYFTRSGNTQMIANVAVSEKTAEETVSFAPDTEAPATIAIYNFFDNTGTESPYVVTTFLFEFRREVLSKGINNVLPIINFSEEQKHFEINKSIVLKWGGEPVELTQVQTKYLNSLINDIDEFNYRIEEDNNVMLLFIDEVNMKYKVILDKGDPRIDMKVNMIGVIDESAKRLKNSDLQKYGKTAADDIEKSVMELLTYLQENNVDPFGFGLRYRATRLSRKDMIEDWNRIYPEIKFNVKVNVELKSTGVVE